MTELFKEICPFGSACDENIALVAVVTLSAQIAEGTQSVQGARDNGFRNVQRTGEAAHGMRPRSKIHQQQQRHLAIGQIRLAGPNVIDKGGHPSR